MGLSEKISDCQDCIRTAGGRAFTEMLEEAADEWTADLIAIDDRDEAMRLTGAIRKIKYLIARVNEDKITKK